MSYCQAVRAGRLHEVHTAYHNHHYGFPITDDDALFERLILEINQAGLSWETILKKQAAFRLAYAGFEIHKVARFGENDVARLLADAGIIRNRLKVAAAIDNARTVLELQGAHGSFAAWLDRHHPRTREEWTKLFRKTFRFTGGEIVHEFLLSSGYLPGAHDDDCPVGQHIRTLKPRWASK